MKKHVLFIVENSSVPYDMRVWNEALAAKEFGYEVTVLTPLTKETPKRHELLEDIEIYRHPQVLEARGKAGYLVEYVNALFWEIVFSVFIFLKKPFHIIHAANPPDHAFIVALLFKAVGTLFVFDHHDLVPETYVEKFGEKSFLHRLSLWMEYLSFRVSDMVISTNESYKRIAIERGKKPKDGVFVVRNGPDLKRVIFKNPNPNLKGNFEFLVVYIGAMNSQDNLENLLDSVKYLVHEKGIENVKFMLVGSGPEWENLVRKSEEMELSPYVKFTGFVPYEDFYEILATADVCVNPEYRNEFTDKSTMIKIMDYMTFGKPIVMFKTTEGEVTAREAAVYVEVNSVAMFGDKLIELLGDREKRKRMGEFARKRVLEELCWDKQKAYLLQAYQTLEGLAREPRD